MRIHFYHINAFAEAQYQGNPAVVCPLDSWLPDDQMLRIAKENAVPETVYFIPRDNGFHIRWFTPDMEMDLCGHATLAAAHVLAQHLAYGGSPILFHSKSGELLVTIENGILTLNFPARMPQPIAAPQILLDGIGRPPNEVLKSRDYFLVYADEQAIRNLAPDPTVLSALDVDVGGIIVTAPGKQVDFVSRFFTPGATIFEDPVTGSAHCSLIPFWAKKLGKDSMVAEQVSERGGRLYCTDRGERVLIGGRAVTCTQGTIEL